MAHTANECNVALNVSGSVDSRVRGKQCVQRKDAPSRGLQSPATACLMMSRAFYQCVCEGVNTRCAKAARGIRGVSTMTGGPAIREVMMATPSQTPVTNMMNLIVATIHNELQGQPVRDDFDAAVICQPGDRCGRPSPRLHGRPSPLLAREGGLEMRSHTQPCGGRGGPHDLGRRTRVVRLAAASEAVVAAAKRGRAVMAPSTLLR